MNQKMVVSDVISVSDVGVLNNNGHTSKLKAFVHHKRVMFSLQLARDIT
jgi:hypothetical protein